MAWPAPRGGAADVRAGDLSFRCGQEHRERGAAARLGLQCDLAAGVLDHAVGRGEAETGALPRSFGGEERFEGALGDFGGHAGARVSDGQGDQLALPAGPGGQVIVSVEVGCLDAQPPAVRHGGAGVHDEVHDDLLDLAAVDRDRVQVLLGKGQELDVLAYGAP